MSGDGENADQLRQQAEACRKIASDRFPQRRGAALLSVAQYFESHARRIERLRERGW